MNLERPEKAALEIKIYLFTVTLPPAFLTASTALLDALSTVILIAAVIAPRASKRMPSNSLEITLALSKLSLVIYLASNLPASIAFWIVSKLTTEKVLVKGFLNPRFGKRR